MNCKNYKNLIEKYLDGIMNQNELADLRSHSRNCPDCKTEFEQAIKLQTAITESLSPHSTSNQASQAIILKLPNKKIEAASKPFFGPYIAIAATITIAAALSLSFYLGQVTAERFEQPTAVKTPLNITNLEGIILVKHQGQTIWQKLEAQSPVYIGDTFHSTAKSELKLRFQDESIINLKQNSMLVLKKFDDGTLFHLEHGELDADLNSPHPPFVVSTPNGRVEALGTEFTVSVE